MRITICLLMAILFVVPIAFAQDPGIQDSIIIGSTYVDSGITFAGVPLYVVTDDDVAYFHMAISFASTDSGILPRWPHTYFPPLTHWDDLYDTVYWGQHYMDFCLFTDDTDTIYLNTHGNRIQIMTLAFNVRSNAHPQLIVLDSTWNPIRGSIEFCAINDTGYTCFTPAFQRGFIAIGPGVEVENKGQTPESFRLNQNYPNPFNPSTNIEFSMGQSGEVSLVIYDLLGRKIKTLLEKSLGAGEYSLSWNGKNESGINVPSGIYLYRLVADDKAETKRMVLIR